jgi:putative intracellular protease/amidase
MSTIGEVITFSLKKEFIQSTDSLTFRVDKIIHEINPKEIDLLIIPGGDPRTVLENNEYEKEINQLNGILNILNDNSIPIAAICAGPSFLARANIIKSRKITHGYQETPKELKPYHIIDQDVVLDENLISAKGNAYVEVGMSLGRKMNVFKSKEEEHGYLQWFKNIS